MVNLSFPLTLLAALALLVPAAHAWTFGFNGFQQGAFTRDGYRPLPFWRIGVWNDDSTPASASPKQYTAHVDVNLRFTGADVVQFFMYDIGVVEGSYYYNYADPSPCMDTGQASGVANRNNLTNLGAVIIDANADQTVSNASWIISAATFQTTGLYAFAFITCRYMYQDTTVANAPLVATIPLNANTANYRRVLYTGPSNLTVDGTVKVYQPYGNLPGQGFGFVPFYAVLFVIIFFITLFFCISLGCAKADRIVAYHWWLLAALLITGLVSILFLAYLGQVNNFNNQNPTLAIATYLLQRLRDCWARIIAVLLARGLGFLRPTKDITVREGLFAGFYGFAFFFCGVAEVVAGGSDQLGVSAVTELSPAPTYVLMVLVELTLAIFMLVVFGMGVRRTLRQLEAKSARRTLFIGTNAVVVLYALINFFVAASSVANNQLKGKGSESGWKYWFLEACVMDGFFILGMGFFVLLWYPREFIKNLSSPTYMDQANYDGFRNEAAQAGNNGTVRRQALYGAEQNDSIAMSPAPLGAPPRPAPSAAAEQPPPTYYSPSNAATSAVAPAPAPQQYFNYQQPAVAPQPSYASQNSTDVGGHDTPAGAADTGGFDDLDRP